MLTLLVAGCAGPEAADPAGTAERTEDDTAAVTSAEDAPRILFVGTSLTAGYGLDPSQAYPALVEERIRAAGLPHGVENAGVSGETSAGALQRINWLLQQEFEVLVLETGANDMLRGTDPAVTRENIEAILERVREARPDAEVVLVGMRAAPNLGPEYVQRFESIYPDLADRYDIPLIPFLLEGVGGEAELNLPDGVHPNAEGQERLAENVWAVMEDELRG